MSELPDAVRTEMDKAAKEAMDEAWGDIGEDYAAALRGADPDKKFKFCVASRITVKPQGGEYVISATVSSGRRRTHESAARVAKGGPA